ncbi:CxC2 domain-containing protein [Mycena indigotica]|uniref:CxC2 domain-containing protein n=1 Tax=Mycena indigotica TaxID=2126181 RepID=A0A8H6S0Z0_9AGAR|nr:CxC2 domain-containing protein [Mycena indigotica]KAF7290623.1 CxC2 domain-containing protein [Mycena indigotica]
MAGVEELRTEEEELRDPDLPPVTAEHIKLWLPSDLTREELAEVAMKGIGRVESTLRRGQLFRNSQVVGQRGGMKANTLLGRIEEQKMCDVRKYRKARLAMIRLEGVDFAPEFKELRDEDLTA